MSCVVSLWLQMHCWSKFNVSSCNVSILWNDYKLSGNIITLCDGSMSTVYWLFLLLLGGVLQSVPSIVATFWPILRPQLSSNTLDSTTNALSLLQIHLAVKQDGGEKFSWILHHATRYYTTFYPRRLSDLMSNINGVISATILEHPGGLVISILA
jgi:hypothetical protein